MDFFILGNPWFTVDQLYCIPAFAFLCPLYSMLQNPVQLLLTLNPPCGYFFFCVQPVYVVFWSFAGSNSNPAAQERGTFRVCSWCHFCLQRVSLDVSRSGVVQGYSDSASSMECLAGIGLIADGDESQAVHSMLHFKTVLLVFQEPLQSTEV